MEKNDFKFKDRLNKCPVCGYQPVRYAFSSHDAHIGISEFSIDRCGSCGLHFVNPQPEDTSLRDFYRIDMERTSEETTIASSLGRYLSPERRKIFIEQRLKPFEKHIRSGKVLDCGCGVGIFVKVLQDAGFSCDGIDISDKAIEAGRSQLGLETLKCMRIEDISVQDVKYDAIVATTVIEHLQDPESLIRTAGSLLGKNGVIALEFPTSDSLSFKVMKEYWHWVMSPYHLFYFNRKSMEILLKKCGFEVISFEPISHAWMWAESIANSLGMLKKYSKWREDADFVAYSIEIDRKLDEISALFNQTSSIQVYARKL